ncbi:phosphoglycolate phosphatase [Pseudomonas oryzihabitans]|uniref:Phosphoglycolate phosphatase n=1 Tax=Pseudomonas oryzihabitans TaxID=47885 RepID=A0A2Z5A2H3_9PSED|nr:phosphoglycolate phosphatase [Pseudomonas oryzihabitans]AXA64985.1 phosphoglycolate phosphatase [Pseudomonas oryzihabitans]
MSALVRLGGGQPPALVMFDLDGTLLDSAPDLAAAVDAMLVRLDRAPAGLDKVRLWIGNGARVLVRRALADDMVHAAVDEAAADEALALFMELYGGSHTLTRLYPGVLDSLALLRTLGVRLAVITNKPERFVAPLLADMGLGDFDWIVGGDTLPQQKPDPAGLLWVMQQAGVVAGQALFIGDSRNDIRAARAAGVRCVALSYGYNHGEPIALEQPDLVVDDLRELFI